MNLIGQKLEDVIMHVIIRAIKRNKGNRHDAAKELGISVDEIYRRIDFYDQKVLEKLSE